MKRIAMLAVASMLCGPPGRAQPADPIRRSPNILVVLGDDIGWFDLSAYNRGVLRYKTPHIDRLADEGMLFTDYYGQETSAAGRAASSPAAHRFAACSRRRRLRSLKC